MENGDCAYYIQTLFIQNGIIQIKMKRAIIIEYSRLNNFFLSKKIKSNLLRSFTIKCVCEEFHRSRS